MTEMTQNPGAVRPAWLPWVAISGIVANVFAIVVVNYWIYYARAAFIARHPDYVAVQPPTISRAISDPVIGEPFAVWVTLSGVLLVYGIFTITLVHARIADGLPFVTRRVGMWLVLIAASPVILQAAASVGMYMLSAYRFPDHNAEHMFGSYLCFIAQSLVILLGAVLCTGLLRSRVTMARITQDWQTRRGWFVLRAWAGYASVASALVYLALFQAKGMDFGASNDLIYAAYVLAEPAVISSFLLVLALFQFDLWAAARAKPSA